MRGVKILAVLFAVLSLAMITLPPRRVRAATCYGSSCNGLNPVTTGCSSDAYVVSSAPVYTDDVVQIGTVYLLWSDTCQAGYGQTVTEEGSAAYLVARVYGNSTNYFSYDNNLTSLISPLLTADDSSDLRATAIIRMGPVNNSPTGAGCTGNGCTP